MKMKHPGPRFHRKFFRSFNDFSWFTASKSIGKRKGCIATSARTRARLQMCAIVRSLLTTGHHNILWHFCNSGRLSRIEKEIRGRESDRSFNPVPRKREPARLARLWPTLLPTLRTLLPIEVPCYQVVKVYLSIRTPPRNRFNTFERLKIVSRFRHTELFCKFWFLYRSDAHFGFRSYDSKVQINYE